MSDEARLVAFGRCFIDGRMFAFDADRVASAVVNGVREPICPSHCRAINVMRAEAGLELLDERDSLDDSLW